MLLSATTILGFSQGNTEKLEFGKYKGLAMTPPMGWNSWNTFATNIDEKLVKETADIICFFRNGGCGLQLYRAR